jgi:hypothetical protein
MKPVQFGAIYRSIAPLNQLAKPEPLAAVER